MSQFLRQTSGDLQAAARLAAAELEALRRKSDGIQASIARMRQAAAANRPPGKDMLAGAISAHDPFQQSVWVNERATEKLPVMARPETSAGLNRTQAALFSVAFTLGNMGEQIASADTKWQKLDRTIGTALQATAGAAVFFGPTGLLVAGVAIAGNALSSFWTQQREDAERTAREWEEALGRLSKGRDLGGASDLAQGLFSGSGGVQDLQRRIAEQQRRRAAAMADPNLSIGLRQNITTDAYNKIFALSKELDEVNAKHRQALAIVNSLSQAEGERAATAMRIAQWEKSKPENVRKELIADTRQLMQFEGQLNTLRLSSADVTSRIYDNYRQLNTQLDSMGDKWSDQAIQIRAIIADIRASPLMKILEGGGVIPKPSITPSGGLQPIDIQVPQLDQMPVTLGQQIRVALQPMIDAIRDMSSYLLNAGLSMLSQYGGQGGRFAAGVIGGAVAGAQIAGPAGAFIGAAVGVVDGLLGMGKAAKEARRQFQEFIRAQEFFIAQQRLALGDMTETAFEVMQLQAAFDAQQGPIEAKIRALEAMRDFGHGQFWDRDKQAELDSLKARLSELNDLERRRIEQLEGERKALDEMTEAVERFRNVPSWFKTNLEVWRAAHGQMMGGGGTGAIRPRKPNEGRRATADGSAVSIGTITINTRAQNGRELLAEFMAELKRQGLATFGAGEEARLLTHL